MITNANLEVLRGNLAEAEQRLAAAQADVDGWRALIAWAESHFTGQRAARPPYSGDVFAPAGPSTSTYQPGIVLPLSASYDDIRDERGDGGAA